MTPAQEPLIDAQHAAFMQRGISMCVAACGRDLTPYVARASGCRLSGDRRQVTVFVSATQAAQVLNCVRDTGALAIVFSEPSTHRTVQLKGKDAAIGALQDGDHTLIEYYRNAFARELEPLGFQAIQIQTLLGFAQDDIVSLTFSPEEAFSQTPGPHAGERLRGSQ